MLNINFKEKYMSITNKVLMIRPKSFSFNKETAVNNFYQNFDNNDDFLSMSKNVTHEFDSFKNEIEKVGIEVFCFSDLPELNTPDSIFSNNWISFHKDGSIFTYPMYAENRRRERRKDIIQYFMDNFKFSELIDIASLYEYKNEFLEGTGSMVLDRKNKIVYAALSDRTNINPLNFFCEKINFEFISFSSSQKFRNKEQLIYHTNVMMSLCDYFVIICLESIKNEYERKELLNSFKKHTKIVINISFDQVKNFCGNVIELKNSNNENILVMSTKAYKSFTNKQKKIINNFCKIVHSPLDTIEKYGGGGARCMITEMFLKKIIN